jgi:uncharacterized protein (TIGR03790 family)
VIADCQLTIGNREMGGTIVAMKRLFLVLILAWSVTALGLGPDNLVLITNKNVAESRVLAEYYAKRRGVPEGRIIELSVPDADTISFADYESNVVPVVRGFLAKPELAGKVTCLVTFYGVPLRVGARVLSPADVEEVRRLEGEVKALPDEVEPLVRKVEALAKQADPSFVPAAGKTLDALSARTEATARPLAAYLQKMRDPAAREQLSAAVQQALGPLVGPALTAQNRMHDLSKIGDRLTPEQFQEGTRIREGLLKMRAAHDSLQIRRYDPKAREELRALVKEQLNPFEYGRLLQGMIDWFNANESDSAVDSELALAQWNFYPYARYIQNPHYIRSPARGAAALASTPLPLMTARLDGPQVGTVRDIIIGSMKAEAEGLRGKAVLDAGGHLMIGSNNPSYSDFDQKFVALKDLLGRKTKLPVLFDAGREVLPANSARDVALYCGWYKVRDYTPACAFSPGAVAYHVASFEMVSLHDPAEKGWCRGLLGDGAAVTIGPVNEPYLTAFPRPDDFFPLLLTGKLTLAEAYWKTCPLVSWRLVLVGDPLYTPYKVLPAIRVEDLSEELRRAFENPGGEKSP